MKAPLSRRGRFDQLPHTMRTDQQQDTSPESDERSPLGELERAIIQAVERECGRICQEMHDGLCQQLVGAAFLAKALADTPGCEPALHRRLTELAGVINAAVQQTRIINHPGSLALGELNLRDALQSLVVPTRQMQASLECPRRLPIHTGATALQLYRIAQEAFLNAVQHSGGSMIKVVLREENGGLLLCVEDDGSGDARTIAARARTGVRLMQIRARAICAMLSFEPSDHGGIRVNCLVPLCP